MYAKIIKKESCSSKRIFENPKKTLRLYNRLRQRVDDNPSVLVGRDMIGLPRVFKARVEGKVRAVKIAQDQNVARWVSDSIRQAHALAVKKGSISPRNYSLKVINFLGQGKNGGVMPLIKTISCEDLTQAFSSSTPSPKVKSFLKKHPWVTSDLLDRAHMELRANLWKLNLGGKIPSFDVVKRENIFILGASDKEKKLIFGLIDQAHPYFMEKLVSQYYSKK